MNARDFFMKVVEMRQAQKTYFNTRDQRDLRYAKVLETEIDREIDRVRSILHEKTVEVY